MGCDCIPPPPIFDLPPPPDPALVWHLLSDEPVEVLHSSNWQTCDYNPLSDLISLNGGLPMIFLFIGACFFLVLMTVCSLTFCWQKCFSRKQSKRPASTNSSNMNTSSRTIMTSHSPTSWSKTTSPQLVTVGLPPYGSSSVQNIAGGHIIRSQHPAMGLRCSRATLTALQSAKDVHAVQAPMDGYYTLTNHYEEIPVDYALPPAARSHYHMPTSRSMMVEPCFGAVYYTDRPSHVARKPPPTCRPPPPPNGEIEGESSIGNDSRGSDELDLPAVIADIEASPEDSRQGRESGYGTGPSQMWPNQSPTPARNFKSFSKTSKRRQFASPEGTPTTIDGHPVNRNLGSLSFV